MQFSARNVYARTITRGVQAMIDAGYEPVLFVGRNGGVLRQVPLDALDQFGHRPDLEARVVIQTNGDTIQNVSQKIGNAYNGVRLPHGRPQVWSYHEEPHIYC